MWSSPACDSGKPEVLYPVLCFPVTEKGPLGRRRGLGPMEGFWLGHRCPGSAGDKEVGAVLFPGASQNRA